MIALSSPLSSPGSDESDVGSDTEWEVTLTHGDLPVYSHDAEPVEPVDALLKAITCPLPLLADAPPTMVTENYCFVLDATKVKFEEVMNNKLWKPTSSPVRYYFSEDLKTFQRVHIVIIRGKVISAVLRTRRPDGKRLEHRPVPLDKVFRVSRHFSHWKTCSKFHKIVSKVSPIQEAPPGTWPEAGAASELPRRIFVQYLWREAKESEKLRVALEYDASLRRTSSVSSLPIPNDVLARRRRTLASVQSSPAMKRSSSSRASGPIGLPSGPSAVARRQTTPTPPSPLSRQASSRSDIE